MSSRLPQPSRRPILAGRASASLNEFPMLARPPALAERERSELAQWLDDAILAPARTAGLELVDRGISATPTVPSIWEDEPHDWFLSSHLDDPTAREFGGRIPVPKAPRQLLDALRRAGIHCDLVWLAHELPAGWQPGDSLLPDTPRVRRHRAVLDATVAGVLQGASKVGAVARGVGRVGEQVAGAGLTGPALGALDPVIFGGIRHPSGAVSWAELARWTSE